MTPEPDHITAIRRSNQFMERRGIEVSDKCGTGNGHTPEPWDTDGAWIRAENHHSAGGESCVIGQTHWGPDAPELQLTCRANARRIVAAVNACQGISTEALEDGVVGELRAALRDAASFLRRWHKGDIGQHCADRADVAIAKAEGKTNDEAQ